MKATCAARLDRKEARLKLILFGMDSEEFRSVKERQGRAITFLSFASHLEHTILRVTCLHACRSSSLHSVRSHYRWLARQSRYVCPLAAKIPQKCLAAHEPQLHGNMDCHSTPAQHGSHRSCWLRHPRDLLFPLSWHALNMLCRRQCEVWDAVTFFGTLCVAPSERSDAPIRAGVRSVQA